MDAPSRSYLVFRREAAPPEVRAAFRENQPAGILAAIFGQEVWRSLRRQIDVIRLPSRRWQIELAGDDKAELPPILDRVDTLTVALQVADEPALRLLRGRVDALPRSWQARLGTDLPLANANHWCPNVAQPLFGTRTDARRLVRGGTLAGFNARVNVVMVDEGLDSAGLGLHYGGGWLLIDPANPMPKLPGSTKGGHGAMTARNVIDLAPGVRLFDMPLVSPHKPPLQQYLSDAHAAFAAIRADIAWLKTHRPATHGQPWLICNAWVVHGTKEDTVVPFYSSDINHPFNTEVGLMVDAGHDTVFAAGNCGTFCPNPRCGIQDRGPGRSILGANAHPRVVSVGAVRTDGVWLGYSSEGPGRIAADKPDVCAPSSFHEDHDAGSGNGGTSAACAVVVGVMAAIRSQPAAVSLSPDAMRSAVNATARLLAGQNGFSPRYGHGVIDAEGLRAKVL